jgi:D-glycero-D-manno-heptose 1,7-bisphosphate phosphatase
MRVFAAAPRRALFLDRDGVVNEDTGYLCEASRITLVGATAEAIRACNGKEVAVIIVSNQSGVGRGYFTWPQLVALDDEIAERLAARRAFVDLTVYAGAGPNETSDARLFRKPEPGMIEAAARLLRIDIGGSALVGDKVSDLEAARRAGIGFGALIGSNNDVAGIGDGPGWSATTCRDVSDAVAAALRFLRIDPTNDRGA